VGFAVGTTAACRALSRTLERPSWLGAVRPTAHRLHGGGASDGRTFWRFTAPRGIAGLAQVGVQRVDILLVAVLLSPADAAVYAVATRFVAVGQLASMAVHQVLQPQFTALLMRGESVALSTVHGTATGWSILLVWPLYLVVLGSPLTYLSLFGDAGSAYARGTSVVVVMAVAMLLAVASGPVDTLLLMAGHSGLSMVNALTALSLDVLLCVLLLPRWGIVGAAVAWAVAVSVRSALGLLQVGRLVRVLPNPHPLLVAGLVPVVCFLLPALGWRAAGGTGTTGWVLVLASGVAGYLVLLSRLRHTLGLDVLHAALVRPPRSPSVRPADPDAAPRGAVHER
jgi:O-antigen/teichoic acid export membrane protein